MKRFTRRMGFLLLLVTIVLGVVSSAAGMDVYYNANIYTADEEHPSASAFVVEDGKFIYVGNNLGALKYGDGTDLKGKRVVPGIVDSHCHPVFASAMASYEIITVDSDWDLEETLEFLKKTAADDKHKDLPFVLGLGFGTDCRPIRATDLDRAIPDRPAMIFSSDAHAYWLNSKAMERANLTSDTPDPVPGASFFERDGNGNPTGYVIEVQAGFDVMRKLNIFTVDRVKKSLPEALKMFSRNGVTTIYEAGFIGFDEGVALQALGELEENGELDVRFFTSHLYLGAAVESPEKMLEIMESNREKYTSELVRADTLKMVADGTLEVLSAWMEADYLPPGYGRGGALLSLEEMAAASEVAVGAGFSIHNHAIGDAAITTALDLHEKVGKIDGTKTICHVQVLPENGIERFTRQNEIFYQTTPVWLMEDKFTRDVLGEERYMRQVPLASLIRGGVTVTFGSDFPVSAGEAGVNPFNNIWVAVARATNEAISPPRSEAISVRESIDAYTINGARQVGASDEIGSITVGKYADFVVCSEDFLEIEQERIKDVTVEATYFRGKRVYSK